MAFACLSMLVGERCSLCLSHTMASHDFWGWPTTSPFMSLCRLCAHSLLDRLGANNHPMYRTAEMFSDCADIEGCLGLCPTFIHSEAEEGGSDSCRSYSSKLTMAGVYNELHIWGGITHGIMAFFLAVPESGYARRVRDAVFGNIRDCFTYDLRRSFIKEELLK